MKWCILQHEYDIQGNFAPKQEVKEEYRFGRSWIHGRTEETVKIWQCDSKRYYSIPARTSCLQPVHDCDFGIHDWELADYAVVKDWLQKVVLVHTVVMWQELGFDAGGNEFQRAAEFQRAEPPVCIHLHLELLPWRFAEVGSPSALCVSVDFWKHSLLQKKWPTRDPFELSNHAMLKTKVAWDLIQPNSPLWFLWRQPFTFSTSAGLAGHGVVWTSVTGTHARPDRPRTNRCSLLLHNVWRHQLLPLCHCSVSISLLFFCKVVVASWQLPE